MGQRRQKNYAADSYTERKPMKTLLFFFDGAPFILVQQWVQEGKLPFLASLKKKGVFGVTKSTLPPITPVAVTGMYTGKNAGKTSVSARINSQGKLVTSDNVQGKAFWSYLSDAGYTSLICFVPMTYPPKPLQGIMITGYGAPVHAQDICFPRSIPYQNEIVTQAREKDILPDKGFSHFVQQLGAMTAQRFSLLYKLEKKQHFDCTLFFLPDSDRLQHFCFHREDLLLEYYQFVDKHLQQLIQKIKYDSLIIATDHGFESTTQRKFSANTWLAEQNYLVFHGGKLGKKVFLSFYDTAIKMIPQSYIIKLRNLLTKRPPRDIKPQRPQEDNIVIPGVNWKKTKAYTNCEWGIRLTKQATEQDKQKILAKLKAASDKGKPAFRYVGLREDVFSGPYVQKLPEIVFLPEKGLESFLTLSRHAFQNKERNDYKYSQGFKIEGMHDYDQNGIFFAVGRAFPKGKKLDCSILDIFPTVLDLFDVKKPTDIDGKSIVSKD